MKFVKLSVALVLSLFVAGSAFAQGQQMQPQPANPDNITDSELKKFAAVSQVMQQIRMTSQQKVKTMVNEEDLEWKRFQTIMMSKQNPKMADSVSVTPTEQQKIKKIQPKLMKVQRQSRKKMMGAMQENEMKPQRFQAIFRAIQSNPEVMKRLQKVAQDSAQQ